MNYHPSFIDKENNKWDLLETHWYTDWLGRSIDIVGQREIIDDEGNKKYPTKTFSIYALDKYREKSDIPINQYLVKVLFNIYAEFDTNNPEFKCSKII